VPTKNQPAFILVNPQMGENIGATARAMLNFGLTDLRLVNPRDGWPNQAAIDMAAGAFDEIDVVVYKTLQEAAKEMHFLFATTARPRDMVKPVFTPENAAIETGRRQKQKQKVGYVFGPERTGLENDDIVLCHAILTAPANPDSPCLNLAQSVVLFAYEIFLQQNKPIGKKENILNPPAEHQDLDDMLKRLEDELETNNFFKARNLKPSMVRNIRNMFMRAEWTAQEVRTFHGIISALGGKKDQ
jgi:tRNA/rRNA methyltransferase